MHFKGVRCSSKGELIAQHVQGPGSTHRATENKYI